MLDEPGLTGSPPIGVGDVVADRYEVRREIGRGGYAIVYAALDRQSELEVALKTIRPVAPRPQEVVARFRREVELVSKLQHPNTVSVYDWGFDDELYLAMELLEGLALADVLDGVNGIEPHRAVAIVRGVLESLSEAHELGIVHRDLKPENVFLTQHADGRETVKVLDFGIAKVIGFSDEEMHQPALTLKGRAMGTPTYMSPEQARGVNLTTRSDIYAVAVLLYELLCGTPPFDGDNAMDVMLKHVNDPIPDLTVRTLRGSPIEKAIKKALAKKPEDRFATAGDFLAALGGGAMRAPALQAVAEALPPDDPSRPRTVKMEALEAARQARSGTAPQVAPRPEGDEGAAPARIAGQLPRNAGTAAPRQGSTLPGGAPDAPTERMPAPALSDAPPPAPAPAHAAPSAKPAPARPVAAHRAMSSPPQRPGPEVTQARPLDRPAQRNEGGALSRLSPTLVSAGAAGAMGVLLLLWLLLR